VLAALVGLFISLTLLELMIVPTSFRGWHVLYLPVPFVSLLLFSVSVVWMLSAIAVVVPDVAQVVNIALLLLMFVSPIGFSADQLPSSVRPLIYLNPLSYQMDAFRFALLGVRTSPVWLDFAFLAAALAGAALSGAFFRRLSPVFNDYE
jgi:lipopolysaccharide transport system permease protein